MTQIPSSQRERKCDQQRPSCSRCSRLKIDCIEGGQKRFKFIDQRPNEQPTATQLAPSSNSTAIVILPSLTSAAMSISNAFVATLRMNEPEFHLITLGGLLFSQIPQRLGLNEALDTSVQALTSAYSSLQLRDNQIEARAKYGSALRALRMCLQDSQKAFTASTLCAIYLLLICQVSRCLYGLNKHPASR